MKEIALPHSKSIIARLLVLHRVGGFKLPAEEFRDNDDILAVEQTLYSADERVDARGSATAARFAMAYHATRPGHKIIDGNEQLRRRPMTALVDALRSMGARVDYLDREGHLPVSVDGMADFPTSVEVDGTESSQNISALMLVAAGRDFRINIKGRCVSHSYITLTTHILNYCGIHALDYDSYITLSREELKPTPLLWDERDWSTAAFWYAMVAVGEADNIKMSGLRPDSNQPDVRCRRIFAALGVDSKEGFRNVEIYRSPIRPFGTEQIDCTNCPDLAPLLMATLCRLGLKFRLTGLSVLKNKESSRGVVMERELSKLGYRVEFDGSEMRWNGEKCEPHGLTDVAGDHRVAMAMIVAGAKNVDKSCIEKSYRIENGTELS